MLIEMKWKDKHGNFWGRETRGSAANLAAMGHVNRSPEHMPLGPADHLLHLQRLAARGERDES
jgi:hypothetical protein